jgi:tRNA-dihydrouridine synthase 4
LTDRLVKTALQAHVSHITIHGRTRFQPSTHPVSLPGIKFAVEAVQGQVPTVGNGDIWDLADVQKMRDETGVNGVMGARGLLAKCAILIPVGWG